ncbi:MAG: NAD(P)H-dependent oxidoreductase [Crocinitomicaceae bacterium]|jgi:nitroreductase|nr:NAD(P)H-dependent oxidoreductase [Crocinitomicaceae bacterium]
MNTTTNTAVEALNWRYAAKAYDKNKKVSTDDMETLLEAIRLAPSSYGLQPYQVFVIENESLREKLKAAGYNQGQITDASHLIVFAAKTKIENEFVDQYMELMAKERKVDLSAVSGFGDYIKNSISTFDEARFTAWNSKQTYIALGILLQTAAELRIDATPMEGFSAEQFNEILGLNERGLTTTLVCPIGYRSQDDVNQHLAKVRRSSEELIVKI